MLVLCAVFIPVAFLPGITGQLYKQFAITIAISVVLSGVVALTLSPALAALLLKPGHGEKRGFFKWFDSELRPPDRAATPALCALAIKRSAVALLLFAGMLALAGWLIKQMPASFLPLGRPGLPPRRGDHARRRQPRPHRGGDRHGRASISASSPAVGRRRHRWPGYSLLDGQTQDQCRHPFVALKDFAERRTRRSRAAALIRQAAGEFRHAAGKGIILPVNPPSIPGLGTTGGLEFWIQSKGDATLQQLEQVTQRVLIAKARAAAGAGPASPPPSTPARSQLLVDVDREKAETLGVPVEDVYTTLQTMFGSLYVCQFTKFSRLFQVILQAEPDYRTKPEDLQNRSTCAATTGSMVPLKAVVTTRYVTGPDLVTRFNNFPAAKITADAGAGLQLGRRRSPRWRSSRARCCRRASATPGAARRSRRRRPARPRPWCSSSR